MEISKTLFKEYSKCINYPYIDSLYKLRGLHEDFSENISLIKKMFSEDGDDCINVPDEQMEVMLPYFQEVERLALIEANLRFNKNFIYHKDTKDQVRFSFTDKEGNEIFTYVDGFYEESDTVTILEIKATTSNKFIKTKRFINNNGILEIDKIKNGDAKIFERTSDTGKYFYDFAITKFIINEWIRNNINYKNKKFNYYLGILNSNFIFNGNYIDNEPDYFNSEYKERLFTFIDCNAILDEYVLIIKNEYESLLKNIQNKDIYKKYNKFCKECIFEDVCFSGINDLYSIKTLIAPKRVNGDDCIKLINNGYYKITDINPSLLMNQNHYIQYKAIKDDEVYFNKLEIIKEIDKIKYPIFHLDFESFFIPLPRFIGEKPYTQSVFQFSIHKEVLEKTCDRYKDNYSFIPYDFSDHRKELVEELIKIIDLSNGGTVLVYNKNFEYNRIKEFMELFPEYKDKLELINEHMFDLMDVVRGSKIVNYYHKLLNGSFSIKKVLPLFSDLSYKELDIHNGIEAIIAYSKFKYLPKEDILELREKLKKYCGLDTYSMVVILNNIKKEIGYVKEA